MKPKRTADLSTMEVTTEEELHGTPTVALADALAKADEDAEEEQY